MPPAQLVFQKPLIVAVKPDPERGFRAFKKARLKDGNEGKFVVMAAGEELSTLRLYGLITTEGLRPEIVPHIAIIKIVMELVNGPEKDRLTEALATGVLIGGGYLYRNWTERRLETNRVSEGLGSVPASLLKELIRVRGYNIQVWQDEKYHGATVQTNPGAEQWYEERGFEIELPILSSWLR